ncbi:MAG: membrane dipeptidase [Parcubacteria group bacterium Gr01-1014_48]|nr:MAG: membrane dipeptidase [Parcubacteria group bacterium Greene0416_14]TSC73400.1 MAG: membrane dipeptidase [Parcubacteria group bacterium Gr01-1014_48]TSD01682.1 MAG: membrane dipeptidase [Parcubacteria group bacterium Greene1014_15]TSD07827.1 MAG: membrane dipeptidase [Parcubacteria group bacterium Greene0714_4]
MTIYADSLGFLFSQAELINKTGLQIDPKIRLDLCHITAAPPFKTSVAEIEEECRFIHKVLEDQGVVVVRNRKDLARDNLKVVLGLQHPPLDATVTDLQRLRSLGVLFCTLAYEGENPFGGGFATPDISLSVGGKKFLRNLAEAYMILDLSHAGHQTARDTLAEILNYCIPIGVVATHTGAYSVFNHLRNLPDDILQGIKYFQGFVGVTTCTFLNHASDNSLQPFCAHIRHVVGVIGSQFVTIGSDGVYKTLKVNEDQERFELMKNLIDPRGNFHARYPDQPFSLNMAYRMKRIHIELQEQWTKRIVERLLGENFFNYVAAHI